MKKYYIRLYDEYGDCYFCHQSDKAAKLLKMEAKEARSPDGNTYTRYYFGRRETNIPEEIEYMVSCGRDV